MPNWAFTTYKIVGDRDELVDLRDKMRYLESLEVSYHDNDFGKKWLGNIVVLLGGDILGEEMVHCRGEWDSYEYDEDNNILMIDMMTAWCEQWEFRAFLEKCYTPFKVYYIVEEFNADLFLTNDVDRKYFKYRYILDDVEGSGTWEFETRDEARQFIEKLGSRHIEEDENLYDIIDEWNEQIDDCDYSYHECEIDVS